MANEHGHVVHAGSSHGSTKSYIIGFILSVILTVIPFGLVMYPTLSESATLIVIWVMAIVQIFVHLGFFLHMNTSSEQRWNVVAFAFTILITVIVVAGSLWIIHGMHSNMLAH
ncbi:cytochrome o ubiquinol oxidase operon protein cyoD [Pseudomonas duriflava]|uniref:Cytochrome bo(3) ubiquinol oxidase subunit 4 n=1 Tax=Pseudomonas duriflava TaxID=459528 RepID=A0A562QBF1_9PSED|nr:cytochrome o ubiquinol oxidase subunit IV [Pseudomonas duriflava]TWI53346.1 cytochrome o ubiquinol oxidase operon protein cyoD [Pseudomonas duriflava]